MAKAQPKPAPASAPTAAPASAGATKARLIPGREAAALTAQFGEKPKYELTEKAYIGDVLWDPAEPQHPITRRPRGTDDAGDLKPLVIEYEGIPGPHMVPMNECARVMFETHQHQASRNLNPVDSLTIVGPGATVLQPQR